MLSPEDAGRFPSSKQKAEQHSCSDAVQQLVEHTREQARLLRAQAPHIARDILEAAKTSARLDSMNGASSKWSAVVPVVDPGHTALYHEVHAQLKQLCKGSGLEIVSFLSTFSKWYLDFALSTPAA